ncbi:P-loop containing nucleoside triphosphate hydrolase protein [Delitschia confertaspora ATCC 74209]|uniref:P-loop containing nucleoside triphosphate hydrolase protein n=1 Tax=Delitschia confertaspora ATCC 74209 TaxID=1513339 RepID=A0A9P4JKU7_9PLEO|nr:P-loop containing nucleoside triphosphate hydrolase protein [Delitschia confertaspora ATCC 74209]
MSCGMIRSISIPFGRVWCRRKMNLMSMAVKAFLVRREFNWKNQYQQTVLDIKSPELRAVLQKVMKDVKGISLVSEKPVVDPNMLFLYLEELRTHYRKTLKAQLKKAKKTKGKKKLRLQIAHCKLLVKYLDQDYAETKKTLYPMLKTGNITFDLLWALFKPNTIAYTQTYGSASEPRCFKVDYAHKHQDFLRGEWWCVEGRYLEYDGKRFGLGEFEVDVEAFKGPRKITSLACYPLQYHHDAEGLKGQLVERGRKFVGLQGMNYRFCKGLAFQKRKKNSVAKVNVNGRVMIDPAIFRKINPNYRICQFKAKEVEFMNEDEDDAKCSECGCDSNSDGNSDGDDGKATHWHAFEDKDGEIVVVNIGDNEDGQAVLPEKKLGDLPSKFKDGSTKDSDSKPTRNFFTEEDLLLASPVVLGFSFSDKLWLEFSLTSLSPISFDSGAFASLVVPKTHKSIVQDVVSSHKFHAAKTIDDVVAGKGRGLVFVLHGPPGVGKTLTAEGIAEHLQCPLYAVSAGELGTNAATLELKLGEIMDIAHSWGALLLLDEADVFLEKREVQDVHRNALVSVFLRQMEYFMGILFLTTNRVETFDEAFQSRIHLALKYGQLSVEGRKSVWRNFVGRVGELEGFGEGDWEELGRKELNGRQIKNAVRSAQAIALNKGIPFSMQHIRAFLEVMDDFNADFRGYGFKDAMRQYV